MKQEIAQIALLINDYDEAIQFFTETINFTLIEDTQLTETKRWVVLAPPSSQGCKLSLTKPANEQQTMNIGNQTDGSVFLFLHTDDLWRDYKKRAGKRSIVCAGTS
jgi:catechol 2,3-dioxygenase-like lactoylglutathione lyase family enzyme